MSVLKRIQYNSPTILTFSLISLLVLVLGILTEGVTTDFFFSVYAGSFADPLFYVRLFGHVFGHVSFEHYFNNFILILLIGPILEEKYGSKTMILMFAITALVTGLLNVLMFETALLGASGIVFMLILLSSFTNIEQGKIPLTLILVIVVFIGDEIMMGIYAQDNISQLTHIMGGICGAMLGFFINRKKWFELGLGKKKSDVTKESDTPLDYET